MSDGYIAVGLDGTLAHYDAFVGAEHIGQPIGRMRARVVAWLEEGQEVRILTARVAPPERGSMSEFLKREEEVKRANVAIEAWCLEHIGQVLRVTCQIDAAMIALYDDRAHHVIQNTGLLIS